MATVLAPAPIPERPKPHWLLGALPAMTRDPLDFMTHCARERGNFVPMRLPGLPQVLVSHPDYVEEVLVRQNANFKKGDEVRHLSPLFGNGLFSSEGAFWLRQRRLLQQR